MVSLNWHGFGCLFLGYVCTDGAYILHISGSQTRSHTHTPQGPKERGSHKYMRRKCISTLISLMWKFLFPYVDLWILGMQTNIGSLHAHMWVYVQKVSNPPAWCHLKGHLNQQTAHMQLCCVLLPKGPWIHTSICSPTEIGLCCDSSLLIYLYY